MTDLDTALRAEDEMAREALIAECDFLLATQGRLMFSRDRYDDKAATDFGIRLLDFFRLHGEKVREAIRTSARADVDDQIAAQAAELAELRAEVERLNGLINTPHTDEWFEAVRFEAAHQIERWGADHDAGKEPPDWFWLLGYLGGKALRAALDGDIEKAKHHTVSSGAMLLNWFRAMVGDSTAMRPGIANKDQQQ